MTYHNTTQIHYLITNATEKCQVKLNKTPLCHVNMSVFEVAFNIYVEGIPLKPAEHRSNGTMQARNNYLQQNKHT